MTAKRLMLILMSTLLVLVVVMCSLVVGEVKDILLAFSDVGGSSSTTENSESRTEASTTEATTEPTTLPTEEENTIPTETEPVETTEPHEHNYVKSKTTAAGCTSMGYTVYKCSCGKTDVRDFRDPLGHKYQEETVERTCEQDGCTLKTCVRCGDVQRENVKAALGHDYQFVKKVDAACEQEGYDEYECSHCHDVKKQNIQPALNHDYGEWIVTKDATDTAPGEWKHICKNCQKEETEMFAAKGDLQIGSRAQIEDMGQAWTHHRIQVGIGTNVAYTYDIYIGLETRNIDCKYDKEIGLTVTYTGADGSKVQKILPAYENTVLTVDSSGNVGNKVPTSVPDPTEPITPVEPTDPVTPTDPSTPVDPDPTVDPTAPSETEPSTEPSTNPSEAQKPDGGTDPSEGKDPENKDTSADKETEPTDPTDPTQTNE